MEPEQRPWEEQFPLQDSFQVLCYSARVRRLGSMLEKGVFEVWTTSD